MEDKSFGKCFGFGRFGVLTPDFRLFVAVVSLHIFDRIERDVREKQRVGRWLVASEREEPRRPMGAQQLHAPLFLKRRNGDYYFTGLFKRAPPFISRILGQLLGKFWAVKKSRLLTREPAPRASSGATPLR